MGIRPAKCALDQAVQPVHAHVGRHAHQPPDFRLDIEQCDAEIESDEGRGRHGATHRVLSAAVEPNPCVARVQLTERRNRRAAQARTDKLAPQEELPCARCPLTYQCLRPRSNREPPRANGISILKPATSFRFSTIRTKRRKSKTTP